MSRWRTLTCFALLSVAGSYAAPSPDARHLYEQGEKAFAEGRMADAEKSYLKSVELFPNFPEALNALGNVSFKLGKYDEARRRFEQSVSVDKTFKLAHFNLGFVCRKLNDFTAAARAYEKYTLLEPQDADGFWGWAESLRKLNQVSDALAAYKSYLEKESRVTEKKRREQAEETVKALEAKIGESFSEKSLAETFDASEKQIKVGNYPEALRLLETVVGNKRQNPEVLFRLGNIYAMMGNSSKAIIYWQEVVEHFPNASIRQGAIDNIARMEGKPIGNGSSIPLASGAYEGYEKGVQQIYAREYSQAVYELTRALEQEPKLAVGWVARGSAFVGLGRYEDAVSNYQMALQLDPTLSSPIYGMAEAYMKLGRISDARKLYEQYSVSTAEDVRKELKVDAKAKAERLKE